MHDFKLGATVPLLAWVYDSDGETLVDPTTSIKATLVDPKGTKKVNGESMSPIDTGKYIHYYNSETTDEPGDWVFSATTEDGTIVSIAETVIRMRS